jgi:hypothetical protein
VVEVDEDGRRQDPARHTRRAPARQQASQGEVRGLVEDTDARAAAPGERAQRVGQQGGEG